MSGNWFVFIVYPCGAERKVSCPLDSHKACLAWINGWQTERPTFRIVNLTA